MTVSHKNIQNTTDEQQGDPKIDFNTIKSFECHGLQKSKYIIIQNDMKKLEMQYKYLKKLKMEDTIEGFSESISCARGKLNLDYCPEKEILKRRMNFLRFKGGFLSKVRLLKQNGNNIQINERLNKWICDNLDQLYDDHKRG